MKYDLIIGIDPDVDKSGVAFIHTDGDFYLDQYTLWGLFKDLLLTYGIKSFIVRLECGHKIKQTWQRRTPGAIKDVGRNNEIGSQIEKFMIAHGIPHELVPPFGGSKVNHETFCKLTGWDINKKTNPETRVAGLLAFNGKKLLKK